MAPRKRKGKGRRKAKGPSKPAQMLDAWRRWRAETWSRWDARVQTLQLAVLRRWRFWLGILGLTAVTVAAAGLGVPYFRFWTALWYRGFGWMAPLVGLGLGWMSLRGLLPSRIPWHSVRALGVASLLAGMGPLLHGLFPHRAGWWGAFVYELLLRALGFWGTLLTLAAWWLVALLWIWNRPLWDVAQQVHQRYGAPARAQLRRWWARAFARGAPTPPAVLRQEPARTAPAPAAASSSPAATTEVREETPPRWVLPDPEEVLEDGLRPEGDEAWAQEQARIIEETLAQFGVPAKVVTIQQGPTVTLFGLEPGYVETKKGRTKVRVSKILALADDLALALAAKRLRVQAPVPGRPYIGIEVPNEKPNLVPLRRVVTSKAFAQMDAALPLALGESVSGEPVVAALDHMPHLLIAGATGSGKSVCLQSMLTTWLLFRTPDQVRFLLIDPKRVELTRFNGLPHLLTPVVTDLEKAQGALQWTLQEMEQRYRLLADAGARDIGDYNAQTEAQGRRPLPHLVVVIDELADMMMLAPQRTEQALIRLAQLARATGIHLVVATQRPSVDVVTGLIKANFPARIAFAVASVVDSRVILDRPGAERLLGRGDMLFLPPDAPEPLRVQGSYVTESEVQRVIQHWRAQAAPQYVTADAPEEHIPLKRLAAEAHPPDPLLDAAARVIQQEGRASITLLQRRLGIGYTRAARLMDQLEARGLVPPRSQPTKPTRKPSSPSGSPPYNESGPAPKE